MYPDSCSNSDFLKTVLFFCLPSNILDNVQESKMALMIRTDICNFSNFAPKSGEGLQNMYPCFFIESCMFFPQK